MLLVDIGNTNLKWILHADLEGGHAAHCHAWDATTLPALLNAQWSRLPLPQRVVMASVAGPADNRLIADWVTAQWGSSPTWVTTTAAARGVTNGYDDPAQLGVDRWAALVAAHHLFSGCKCVVDVGTALTCDVLTGDGRHLGGMISPGLTLMHTSLATATDGVDPTIDDRGIADTGLGTTTGAGVHIGTLAALVGVIEHAQRYATSVCGLPVTVILCGGDAGRVLPGLDPGTVQHEPELVLKGLALLAENGVD
jgi:type III pantothenate kinase